MICTQYDHAFVKGIGQKLVDYKASLVPISATSEPSPLGTHKSARTSGTASAAAAPNASVLLRDRPLPRYWYPFEEDDEQGSDFELDTSLPKVSSDRELRPRASRAICV